MNKEKRYLITLIIFGLVIIILHVFMFYKDDGQQVVLQESSKVQQIDLDQNENVEYATNEEVVKIEEKDIKEEQEIDYERGLFSWDRSVRKQKDRADLYLIIDYLKIDELYQNLEDIDSDDEDAMELANELNLIDVDLYMLTGSSEWTYDTSGAPMLEEIERAVAFRENWGTDTLKGIVFDIEPYVSDRWDEGEKETLMSNYVSGMKVAYREAKENNIRVVLAIPTWYDQKYNKYLEGLIEYCDEIAIMNYVKKREYDSIVDEVEYAKEKDIAVTSIIEMQREGSHDITEENTYYSDGIDVAIKSFEDLYQKLEYPKLKLAFHYLDPIKEILLDWKE